jgi:hypothetical protein
MDASDNNISWAYDIMTLRHIVQQLLFLDHNQWKKTLNEGFKILGPTLELTYYVLFIH